MKKQETIKVVNKSTNELPEYAHPTDAGFDLRADLSHLDDKFWEGCAYDEERKCVIMFSGGRCLIPTGLHIKLPKDYELQIRPRSGLALKNGIMLVNSPGTIDENYTGDIGIILLNTSGEIFEINQGDRIAQGVLAKVERLPFELVETLEVTDRGETGFGESGIK